MTSIVCIVEGHGEVTALPVLIRRIAAAYTPEVPVVVPRPIRVKRDSMIATGGIENAVELAARQTTESDGILILLDADDDCHVDLAQRLLQRAREQRPDRRVCAVIARREFEAWFLAGARSLRGKRGLRPDLDPPADPESVRDAKGWLTRHSDQPQSYKPSIDQPALANLVDLDEARQASSFDKLVRDLCWLLSES